MMKRSIDDDKGLLLTDLFFGEPALDIQDWIRTDAEAGA